ncbi:hypothetical protein TNCV_3187631 [Trichonephila clavipes]|nr:hypothetical protein TNCV_3187631 [Trichonephila clavipes]
MRSEGHEIPGYIEDLISDPPYRRPEPRVFRRPPYVQQLMPTSQENALFSTAKKTRLDASHQCQHNGQNRSLPRAHFNDSDARDAARETRRIGISSSAGPSPCLHHLLGT